MPNHAEPGKGTASPLGNKEPPQFQPASHGTGISKCQKRIVLSIAFAAAGYAAFADSMECIYTILPLRYEYQFDQNIPENKWLIVTAVTAGIYGLSTLLCEGKGVYDTARDYFINRNQKNNDRESEERLELSADEVRLSPHFAQPSDNKPRRGKLASATIWFTPRFIAFVGSAADSSETTMGLVKEGAALPKTIAISTLSFLGSIAFYGPLTVEAMDELFLGKTALQLEDRPSSHLLAKLIGYPVALFSSVQDTLECGASLFQNFGVTGTAGQWGIVSASSLAGISGLCLDGKKGVEIIDNFFTHLENQYAWLPQAALCKTRPSRAQLVQLFQETATMGLAAYGANFIAFADKELTISLTKEILATLNANIPVLPEILGWCVVLRDFVIQTNTLNMLEHLMLKLAHRGWGKIKQTCCAAKDEPPLPELEDDVELARRPAKNKAKDSSYDVKENDDSDDEKTELLVAQRSQEVPDTKNRSCFQRFFKAKPKYPKRDYLEPERGWGCQIM